MYTVYQVTGVATPKIFEQCVVIFPTRPTTITVRFPAPKKPVTPGFGQLLGGGNDFWKEKGLTLILRGRWAVRANRFGNVEEDRLILRTGTSRVGYCTVQSCGRENDLPSLRRTNKTINQAAGWGSFGGNSHHHLSMISSLSFLARSGGIPASSRNEVAIVKLVLVLVKQLENDILTAVAFLPRTGTRVGHVKRRIRHCRRPLRRTSRASYSRDLDWVG
ncbi:hypothetical protein EDB85DRAFT_2171733 [Lactarius pseudohatsudake]|nr:hypothetical protein EDB85DRAFT_2171733 [Lactarius pseudohatsudake]